MRRKKWTVREEMKVEGKKIDRKKGESRKKVKG